MMTIYEIKERTQKTAPFFFARKNMAFFGQTLRDFSVIKQKDGRFRISAPSGPNWRGKHKTVRYFNPANDMLEHD